MHWCSLLAKCIQRYWVSVENHRREKVKRDILQPAILYTLSNLKMLLCPNEVKGNSPFLLLSSLKELIFYA